MENIEQDFFDEQPPKGDPMRTYIGAKIIRAFPEDEHAFLDVVKGQTLEDGQPSRHGYRVIYPDGYVSWSPKETFETAYREVTKAEKDLI